LASSGSQLQRLPAITNALVQPAPPPKPVRGTRKNSSATEMSCNTTKNFAKRTLETRAPGGNFGNKFKHSIRRFQLQKPQTPTMFWKINDISGLITGQPIEISALFADLFAERIFLVYQPPQE
jgi:hypothetical protein